MANIQIRRYVQGTGWVDLHPRTLVENVMGGANNNTPLVNSGGKINTTFLPDYLLGQLVYGGVVVQEAGTDTPTAQLTTNAKSKLGVTSNTISLTNDTSATTGYTANEGLYYIFSGDRDDVGYTVLGIADVRTGDWLVASASGWKKIDNTDAVTSVAGKVGAVALSTSDISGLSDALGTKVDKVSGKGLSTEDFTSALLTKLNGIEAEANKITIDSALSSTSTNPVQNKIINSALAGKVDKVSGKGLSTNDFTNDLKTKLEGIAAGANKYIHPNFLEDNYASGLYKLTLNESGHITAAVAVQKSDITALGIPSENTTYNDATTSTHGLMTAANLITLNNLRAVGNSNPASATDGDICLVTVN